MARILSLVATSVLLLSVSCGSSDGKRRAGARPGDAGTGGAASTGGAANGSGGRVVSAGGSASSDDAGSGGSPGDSGLPDASIEGGGDSSAPADAGPPLVCDPGLGDCDGVRDNGCETTLAGNAEHCNACGRDCTSIGAACGTSGCAAAPLFTDEPINWENSGAQTWAFGNGAIFQAGYNSYTLTRYPLDGSASSLVWSGAGTAAGRASIALYGTDVYWAERGTPSVVLRKSPTAPAATNPTVFFTPDAQPMFLKVLGSTLYFVTGDYQAGGTTADAGFVYSRPMEPAQPTEPATKLVDVSQGVHGAIVAFTPTADALYWVTADTTSGGTAYEVRTAPLAGGEPAPVPGGAITGYPFQESATLVADGATVYFNRNVDASFLNGIYSFEAGDAAPVQLVVAEDVTTFVMDERYFYYVLANQARLYRAPRAGGAGEPISDTGAFRILGQDARFVYVTNGSSYAHQTISRVLK